MIKVLSSVTFDIQLQDAENTTMMCTGMVIHTTWYHEGLKNNLFSTVMLTKELSLHVYILNIDIRTFYILMHVYVPSTYHKENILISSSFLVEHCIY